VLGFDMSFLCVYNSVYAKLKCPKTDGIACPDIAGI
jgi:hypothetical protein